MTPRLTATVLSVAAALGCGGGGGAPDAALLDAAVPPPDAGLPPPVGQFPPGFLWGTAIAPYQVEGGLHADDWYLWEAVCRNCSGEHADDGPDFWNRYEVDLDNAQAMGTNALRLGIEWARVFPTETSFPDQPDAAAVQRYHDILAAARARGIDVMVTLHHFATPVWLADLADRHGWEDAATADAFARWARFCAEEYGGEVDWWVTINEPLGYVAGGWIGGVFPPGKTLAIDEALNVTWNLIRGHALAYDAIHQYDTADADGDGTAAWVSIASHNRVFLPLHADSADDGRAADLLRLVNNRLFLDAVSLGDEDKNFDGDYDDPGDLSADPSLAGRLDYIGLNYYGVTLVSWTGDDSRLPFIGLPFMNDLDRYGIDAPITDFGGSIYPQGFRTVLDELVPYGLPILVTENGIADADDNQRPRFIVDHLYALAQAIDDGLPIRGYFHWSLMDNFEWASGYCPRLGLTHVDFSDPDRPRSEGEGAQVYREIIEANTVPPSLFAEYPGYPPADVFCTRVGF